MEKRYLMAAALAAVMVSGAAPAGKEPQEPGDPDELICRYETRAGTHIKRRVCATRAERDESARISQDAWHKFRNRTRGGQGPKQGGP